MGASLLSKYLDEHGESKNSFAARAGVSPQALGDWVKGRRGPDVSSALAIARATGGAVPFESWERTDKRRHAAPHPPKRVRRRSSTKSAG